MKSAKRIRVLTDIYAGSLRYRCHGMGLAAGQTCYGGRVPRFHQHQHLRDIKRPSDRDIKGSRALGADSHTCFGWKQ